MTDGAINRESVEKFAFLFNRSPIPKAGKERGRPPFGRLVSFFSIGVQYRELERRGAGLHLESLLLFLIGG